MNDALIGVCLDGRYHITGVLGHGGMGTVYEGLHEQLGRAVAIKVLGPNTATDPVVVERFLREARIASSLGHGNIVDVSDLGRLQDGRPYLVMPRVNGVDFATLLEHEASMPPARVTELLRGVAAALDIVHAKGLAHRDVKPENLLHVVHEDGSETVMLTDFGIVGLIDVKAARLTADGMVCGTPAYMAPELISTGEFDRRADVYALATVAFEMLTGRLPFDQRDERRILSLKVARQAPALGAVTDHRFAPALEQVVARGLARDPDKRFQSAGEFMAAFDAAQQPAARDVDVASAPTRREIAQPGRLALAPMLGAAIAVSVTIVLWSQTSQPARPASPPRRPPAAAPAPIAPKIAVVPQPSPLPPPPPAAEPSQPSIEVPPPASTPARALRALPPRRTPLHVARVPVPAATPQSQPQPPSIQPSAPSAGELNRMANQVLLQGRIGRAIELFERASEQDPASTAAYRGLGVANERLGRTAEAAQAYRRALELQPQGPQSGALRERLQKLDTR